MAPLAGIYWGNILAMFPLLVCEHLFDYMIQSLVPAWFLSSSLDCIFEALPSV